MLFMKYILKNDLELKMVIEMIIYDLKSFIDNIDYNYQNIQDKKLIRFSKTLQKWFNSYVNKDITLTEEGYNNLKDVFTLPIKCLLRIYDSIEFWHDRYGNNGYYRMLEEYVLPIFSVGDYTYILEYKYISSND